MRKFIFAVFLN